MQYLIRTLVAVAVAFGTLVLASPADADDQRQCVSKREFRGMKLDQTRAELEARWEVTGRGRPSNVVVIDGRPLIGYRACGYSVNEALVLVEYQPVTNPRMDASEMEVVGAVRWMAYGATVHGHN